jgi:hypothetical protein
VTAHRRAHAGGGRDRPRRSTRRCAWLAIVAVLAGALAACGDDLRAAGVGEGGRWTDEHGERVPNGRTRVDGAYPLSIDLRSGPDHCGWNDVLLLDVVWPLGDVVTRHTDQVRQYVWDADSSHRFALAGRPDADATPPSDAADTGYRFDGISLWIAPSDADASVYLRQPDGTFQQWPRSPQPLVCS